MAGCRDFRAAVVFHGNGVYDGTETTEAVSLLVGLSKLGAEVQVYAPDRDQAHVVNHLNGEEIAQTRNVKVESARISRGDCKDLAELKSANYDALLIPGGFGAAKNLCDFGFKGPDMTVQPDIEAILKDFHSNNKVIGLTCIAPIVAAKVLGSKGVKMTLGDTTDNFPYAGSIEVASSFGANMQSKTVLESCTDWSNKIVTTPAYMQGDAKPHEVFDGIQTFLEKVNSLVKQKAAVDQKTQEVSDTQASQGATEMQLMTKVVAQSVNRIWDEFETSGDGLMEYDEARKFLREVVGTLRDTQYTENDLKKIWDTIDKDKDGKINKGEMTQFVMNLSKF